MDSFIVNHLQKVSRTYAILIPMLPRGLSEAVGLAYLVMRIVDTLEDAPQLSPEQRLHELDKLDAILNGDEAAIRTLDTTIGETDDELALLRDAPEVFRRVQDLDPVYRDAVSTCARAMSGGVRKLMARSAERGVPYPAVRNAEELREYCYYVAGVVGEMLCTMMAHFLKLPALVRLRELAVELGIGLQLVNILKDALKDAKQGRRYLPTAEGGAVAHKEIYRAVLNEARHSLQRGIDFVLALPAGARELRSFCGLPIAWGAMTLARAEQDETKAKIDRGMVGTSIELFRKMAGNDRELREWLSSLVWPGKKTTPAASGQLA